jgi:metal-responsive CopG/Arc/MetJ family transcriptional regulator
MGFSVPPKLKKEVETLAKEAGMTKSEFFREMVRAFKQREAEKEFLAVQKMISESVRKKFKGKFTEEEVEKLVLEGR